MKKIYIYDNTNSLHIDEAIATMLDIFKNDYEVNILLTNKSFNRVKNNTYILNKVKNKDTTIFDIIKSIKTAEIVVYPTISARNIAVLFLLSFFSKKNIYYIRNSNSWLRYSNHQKNIKNKIISNISTFLKKIILKKSYKIFVANNNIKNYLESHHIDKDIRILPYKLFDEKNAKIVKYIDEYRFVIPGAIDISKKDLMLIRNATKLLDSDSLNQIKIILLGKPSRDIDLCFCESWQKEIGESLQYFTSFIPDKKFTEILSNAHFVVGVLSINYEDKYNKEIYGESKDTGIDAQAVAYGKPLIINDDFKVIEEIGTASIGFKNSEHLADIFYSILHDNKYEQLALEAFKNAKKISVQNIQKNIQGLYDG